MSFSFFVATLLSAEAHVGPHSWPQYLEDSSDIAYWSFADGWYLSPYKTVPSAGTRLGLFVDKIAGQSISLEARTIQGNIIGEWSSLSNEFNLPTLELWIQNFEQPASIIQFRTQDPSAMQSIEWDILTPINEAQLPDGAIPPPTSSALSQPLIDLGVIPRTQWGAQTTTCTSTENTWYRMAIHHVASSQTYNGTVEERLQAVQAWTMSSAGYCDVPYQYLVGYDGTLWEGRRITFYSGATGGGQNDGNIAVSFIGCYDQTACMNSYGFYDDTTEPMMAWARELIQVLSSEHGITVNSSNIKGHRDWPGNSTACPGQGVVDLFDELLSPTPPYEGLVTAQSHTGTIEIELGQSVNVWVDVSNTGQREWNPASTTLAPTPRDVASALVDSSWASDTRVMTVGNTVASGDGYRFNFTLAGNTLGTYTQHFSLLEEWFTWFADTPYAGSPADDDIIFFVNVIEPVNQPEPSAEPSAEPSSAPSTEPSWEPSQEQTPSEPDGPPVYIPAERDITPSEMPKVVGEGCNQLPVQAGLSYVWLTLLGVLRRRNRTVTQSKQR